MVVILKYSLSFGHKFIYIRYFNFLIFIYIFFLFRMYFMNCLMLIFMTIILIIIIIRTTYKSTIGSQFGYQRLDQLDQDLLKPRAQIFSIVINCKISHNEFRASSTFNTVSLFPPVSSHVVSQTYRTNM